MDNMLLGFIVVVSGLLSIHADEKGFTTKPIHHWLIGVVGTSIGFVVKTLFDL